MSDNDLGDFPRVRESLQKAVGEFRIVEPFGSLYERAQRLSVWPTIFDSWARAMFRRRSDIPAEMAGLLEAREDGVLDHLRRYGTTIMGGDELRAIEAVARPEFRARLRHMRQNQPGYKGGANLEDDVLGCWLFCSLWAMPNDAAVHAFNWFTDSKESGATYKKARQRLALKWWRDLPGVTQAPVQWCELEQKGQAPFEFADRKDAGPAYLGE